MGLEGVICLMDNILVHRFNQQEHDKWLLATLEQLQKCHITLNKGKCEFCDILRYIIDYNGIKPDPGYLQNK